MKYLNLYNSHSEYLEPTDLPNVSYCDEEEIYAVELWANAECTERPVIGAIDHVYCLLNKDFYERSSYDDYVDIMPSEVEGDPNTIYVAFDWTVDVPGITYDENKQYIPAGVYELQYIGNSNASENLPLDVDSFSFGDVVSSYPLGYVHYNPVIISAIEIWGNQECTERPSGEVNEIYMKFNKTFTEDYRVTARSPRGGFYSILHILFSELDNLINIYYYSDFTATIYGLKPIGGTTPSKLIISEGSVIKLTNSYEAKDLTDYEFSFGEKIKL